ncbi:hypothetical protein CR513_05473, partial [Mucuna pruriens]
MDTTMQYQTKHWTPVAIRIPDTQLLKQTVKELRGPWRRVLEEKYGTILGLLKVEVQLDALVTLVQFYDVPLRYFTFKDFQLSPTLEEYERILGMPIEGSLVYFHKGYLPSWGAVARLLGKSEAEIVEAKKARNRVEGLPQSYLEAEMIHHQKAGNWQAVVDTLGLLIYGIILFLHLEDYIDLAAIDVFMAVKEKNENPIPPLLRDTYYTLNYCRGRQGKSLRCCVHILYLWMTALCNPGRCKTKCPVEDYKWGCIKRMTVHEWIYHLMEMIEGSVHWYPKWNERETFIASCGKSPNDPLMGTQGCSNYNPIMALRQNGYPMMTHPMMTHPSEELMTPLELHGRVMQDVGWFRKIRQAWKQVMWKGPECGARSCGATTSYKDWLRQRVERNGLPFIKVPKDVGSRPAPETSDPPIVKELEGMLRNAKAKRKALKRKLSNAISLQVKTKEEVLKERRLHMQASQEAHRERELRVKIGECLKVADREMCLRREEKDQAISEKESLKEALKSAKRKEVELKGQLYGLRERLDLQHEELLKVQSHKEAVEAKENLALCELAEERKTAEEKEQKIRGVMAELLEEVIDKQSQYQELSIQTEMKTQSLKEEADYWKDRYNKTVWLANQALEELPHGLRAAKAMINPLTTPLEISEFLDTRTNVLHPYGTHPKSRQMENVVEALEQRNKELRSEMAQMKEQMSKILELLTRGPPHTQNTADYPHGYTPPPVWNAQEE